MRLVFLGGLLSIFFVSPAFCGSVDQIPSNVTSWYLDYQDKLNDATLDLSTNEALLKIAKTEYDLLNELCALRREHILQGNIRTRFVTGCEIDLVTAQTKFEQADQAVKGARRKVETWTIRLAQEGGDPIDLEHLALLYVKKWVTASDVIESQITSADRRLEQARTYIEFAERMHEKHLMTDSDYLQSVTKVTTAEQELDGLMERQSQILAAKGRSEALLEHLHREHDAISGAQDRSMQKRATP